MRHIPGARLIEIPGAAHVIWLEDPEPYVSTIERYLASVQDEETELDRMLATVLFTDIVGSTDKACELGDRRWTELLERHGQVTRSMLARYRGAEVKTTGDGFLATFDGPAARCEVRAIGLRGGAAAGPRGARRLPHRRDRAQWAPTSAASPCTSAPASRRSPVPPRSS